VSEEESVYVNYYNLLSEVIIIVSIFYLFYRLYCRALNATKDREFTQETMILARRSDVELLSSLMSSEVFAVKPTLYIYMMYIYVYLFCNKHYPILGGYIRK
jgi:hypothetical protein